jgi:hypothetical protein
MPMTLGLSALVHHVELTKSGWRDRALELMAVSTLFSAHRPQTVDQVTAAINQQTPAPLGRAQIEALLEKAASRGTLLRLGDGRFKLSEDAEAELESNLSESRKNTERVAALFEGLFDDLPTEHQPDWDDFYEHFLQTLVSELGLRTYEVLSQEAQDFGHATTYRNYLDRFDRSVRGAIADRLGSFFDPNHRQVRRFLLRELNAQMLVRSTALSENAYQALEKASKGNFRLTAFLDTNFLFSLIGLHDNPADDVVDALKEILPRVKGHVDVRLYVLPITVDEAKETIGRYREKLSGLTLGRGLANAARNRLQDLSGITLKYVQEATKGKRPLSAKEYFRPYEEDLITICRERGVELYNVDLSPLRTEQKVIDDLNDQVSFQEKIREKGAKPYPVILHDMVLWHFTNDQRPQRVESPAEAEYWVATIDFGLLGFDAHKSRGKGRGVPLCIHPTVLLQMLQFWIPQSEELERALVDSLRPMLPHEYDRESEETTISMLQALSRFEGVDDLGEEVIGRVLVNDALRTRVRATPEVAEQVELVRDAIVQEAAAAEERVQELQEKEADLKRTVADRDQTIKGLSKKVDTLKTKANTETTRLEEELRESRDATTLLEKRLDRLEREREWELEGRNARRDKAIIWVSLTLAVGLAGATSYILLPAVLERLLGLSSTIATVVAMAIGVGLVLVLSDPLLQRYFGDRGYLVVERLHSVRIWLWSFVGLILGGLLVNYLYDALTGPGPG